MPVIDHVRKLGFPPTRVDKRLPKQPSEYRPCPQARTEKHDQEEDEKNANRRAIVCSSGNV